MIPLATIATYASQIAGTPVTISCEADATFNPSWDGYALSGADGSILHVIHVRQSICGEAENVDRHQDPREAAYLLFAGHRADLDAGEALETIEHEALHIRLHSTDEGVVDCSAYQNRWAFVRLFKLPERVAKMVMNGMAWMHEQRTGAYRTVC
jgi:hypothetical protein